MKRYLLIGLSLGIGVTVSAQNKMHAVKQNTLQSQNDVIDKTNSTFYQSNQTKPTSKSGNRAVSKKYFTSSWNAYGVQYTWQNCLNANQATNTVAFTHRISQDWAPANVNSGFIQCTFTDNNGSTFDSILLNQDQTNLSRYPTGAIFNPSGNTTKANMISVVSGPITDGTNWMGCYYASSKFDGTANNVNTVLNASAPIKQYMSYVNMAQSGNNVFSSGMLCSDPAATTAAAFGYRGATLNKGAFNTGTNDFTWTVDSIIPAMFTGQTADPGKECYSTASIAWNKTGTIGYVVFVGVAASATGDKQSFQPMVYKTTNGGTSWTLQPAGDFSGIPSIAPTLSPSTGGTKKAFYSKGSGFATVVDVNDNLHIVCQVVSANSDNVDSLGYTWTRNDNISYIFDTYTTSTGWDAMLVDSLLCVSGESFSPFTNSQTGKAMIIDARIQVSMSDDRTKLFYMWTDTDPTLANGENVLPEIKGRGYNVNTGGKTATLTFTSDGDNFYMFASTTALTNGGINSIPCTSSNSRGNSGDGTLTFDHYYISGIEFNDADFLTGVEEVSANGKLTVSQNYPNPFNNVTSVNVSLKESANVSLDVYNAIGQKVYAINAKDLNAGTHTLKIEGANLNAGIYFYTVNASGSSITRKMMVK